MANAEPSRRIRGVPFPTFLYGTAWKEERTGALVELALGAGFRGFDTANQRKHYYEAQAGAALGAAIAEQRCTRDELFLQSKFTFKEGQDQRLPYDPRAAIAEQVRASFESSLAHFGTDYLDSYLLHGPSSRSGLAAADWDAWRAMEALANAGRAKLIGVSNVSLGQLRELCGRSSVRPAFVQNRCYASTGWDRDVRAFSAANDIVYQGFSLLTANRRELADRRVVSIAERHRCSIPEVVFRFALELGMLPLTGTSSREHLQQDRRAAALELDASEVETLLRIAS